jgi:hypothetical protein
MRGRLGFVRRWALGVGRWALVAHIMKLLTHIFGSPEQGDQESTDEAVKQVNKNGENENIHGLQI